MRRVMRACAFALVAALLLSTVWCFATETAVTGETVTAVPGETIDYVVSIEGNPGLVGFHFRLYYDTSVLTYADDDDTEFCEQGDFSAQGSLVCAKTSYGCQVFWSHTSDVASDGTLFTLKLHVQENAPLGEYPIRIETVAQNTVNKAEERVAVSCVSGAVTVRTFCPTIYGETLNVEQGDEFDFVVSLRDNPGVAACNVIVRFDPDVLLYNGIEHAPEHPDGMLHDKAYTNEVEVLWSAARDFTEDGGLFVLRFTVKDSAPVGEHLMVIRYNAGNTLNEQEQAVSFLCENGSLQVAAGLLLGDIDCNGVINTVDASMALRFYVDAEGNPLDEVQQLAADVDKNGAINTVDASMILQHYVGSCKASCPMKH